MAYNFNLSFGRSLPNFVERDVKGNWFYSMLFGSKKRGGFKDYECMLNEVLQNPAILKVLTFRADVYSQVRIDSYKNDKIDKKNILFDIQKRPNYWQTWSEFHFDVEFYRCLGSAYIYKQGESVYCLNPAKIKIDKTTQELYQRLIFSQGAARDFKGKTFKYKLNDNKETILELSNLYILSDLTGSLSNDFFAPPSRLESLYQVAINGNLAITSKTRNLEFTQKYLISGQHTNSDTSSLPMGEEEKDGIEKGLLGHRAIHATESKVDFTHLVSNLKALGLDESYLADLTIVANMYGVDTDVLGISTKKSSYENKEKGIGAFIDYTLMPKVQQLTELYEQIYELEDVRGTFEHLPFNQIFQAEKVTNDNTKLTNLKLAQELGVDEKILKEKATLIIGE